MSESTLSPRQIACLEWVAAGKTSWETACILSITERTVNFHLQHAYRRLGVHTRAAAVASAIRQGLVQSSFDPLSDRFIEVVPGEFTALPPQAPRPEP